MRARSCTSWFVATLAAIVASIAGCGSEPETEPQTGTPSVDGGPGGADADAATAAPDGGAPGDPPPPCSHPDCPVATLARDDSARLRAVNLVVHGDRIFYQHGGNTEPGIYSLPKAGGERKKLAPLKTAALEQTRKVLAVDAAHVYFLNLGTPATLERVPTDGGAPEVLATAVGAACLVVDGDSYFWSEPSTSGADRRGLWKRAKAGGDPTRIADDEIGACAGHDANMYWLNQLGLRTVAKSGGAITTINASPASTTEARIVAGPTGVFVGLSRYPLDGGGPETISTGTLPGSPIGLALDGATLYWMQKEASQSTKGPVLRGTPGTPAVRLTYSVQANDVAVDETYVYWGDYIGAIRRIAK